MERVVIPRVVYGSEMWVLSAQEGRKLEVFEMMSLRVRTEQAWQVIGGEKDRREIKGLN